VGGHLQTGLGAQREDADHGQPRDDARREKADRVPDEEHCKYDAQDRRPGFSRAAVRSYPPVEGVVGVVVVGVVVVPEVPEVPPVAVELAVVPCGRSVSV
jgi:hypothetical protein